MIGKIVNYFITSSFNNSSRCFRSPLTINHSVALVLLRRQFREEMCAPLMHVCFDTLSKRIYVLNSSMFSEEEYQLLLDTAKMKILKDFGNYKNSAIIKGSPYSSFRIRDISDFHYAKSVISQPLTIVEANLDRMPTTRSTLPKIYSKYTNFMGSLINQDVDFIDEIDDNGAKRDKGILLERQLAPFVLINTSHASNPSSIEKEHIILSAYRDLLSKDGVNFDEIDQHTDLYKIKSHLCLGWSFEEMSSVLLRDVNDFGELIIKLQRLLTAVDSLVEDGYKDVAAQNYYTCFKMSENFPIKLSSIMDLTWTKTHSEKKIKGFEIVDFDHSNYFITLRTPVFIPPEVCKKVFKIDSDVSIYQYNPIIKKIDIKTSQRANVNQHNKILKIIATDEKINSSECRMNASSMGEWAVNPNVFNIKKVSDYLYVYNHIRKQCEESSVTFKDLDVIVGPIEKLMGKGSQGGFVTDQILSEKQIKFPYHIEDGISLNPPAILINSITEPSCVQQITTLLHEYRHYVYSRVNMYHKNKYEGFANKTGDNRLKEWHNYFSDPNEVKAHSEEIKFELMIGKSEDEIIRDKVGGAITVDNYPIAIAFKKLVDNTINKESK